MTDESNAVASFNLSVSEELAMFRELETARAPELYQQAGVTWSFDGCRFRTKGLITRVFCYNRCGIRDNVVPQNNGSAAGKCFGCSCPFRLCRVCAMRYGVERVRNKPEHFVYPETICREGGVCEFHRDWWMFVWCKQRGLSGVPDHEWPDHPLINPRPWSPYDVKVFLEFIDAVEVDSGKKPDATSLRVQTLTQTRSEQESATMARAAGAKKMRSVSGGGRSKPVGDCRRKSRRSRAVRAKGTLTVAVIDEWLLRLENSIQSMREHRELLLAIKKAL